MKNLNIIAIIADKDGTALIPQRFLAGTDKLTGDMEVDFCVHPVDARHFRKLNSKVMEAERKRVLKIYPGFVVEIGEVAETPAQAKPPAAVETNIDQKELDANADIIKTEGDEEEDEKRMSSQLEKYRKDYLDSVSSSGKKSKISGDEISLALVGLTPEEVMDAAERILGLTSGELVARYEHLNPGQRRMNAGNGVRAAVKRGDITIDDFKKLIPGLH